MSTKYSQQMLQLQYTGVSSKLNILCKNTIVYIVAYLVVSQTSIELPSVSTIKNSMIYMLVQLRLMIIISALVSSFLGQISLQGQHCLAVHVLGSQLVITIQLVAFKYTCQDSLQNSTVCLHTWQLVLLKLVLILQLPSTRTDMSAGILGS